MTNRRVDHGFPGAGTQPLSRSTSRPLPLPPVALAEPKSMAKPDASAVAGRTFELPQSASPVEGKLQELSDAKLKRATLLMSLNTAQAEAEKKKEAAAKEPLWKRALNGVKDAVTDGVQSLVSMAKEEVNDLSDQISKLEKEISEAVHTGGKILDAGYQEFEQSRAEGQSLFGSIKDAAGVAGQKTYDDVIDPRLDASILGKDDEYQDQGVGGLGPVLTNRLGIGESVSIKIEAGATIPLEEFGIPNAKLDAGGTLSIARVQKTDARGHAIEEPKDANGNPPTELKVVMELEGRAGASYSANVGFDSTVKAGGYEAGIKATAGAEAEAGLRGRVAFAFAFDPADAKDMGVLTGMMKMAGTAGAESAIPGIGMLMAGQTVLSNQDLVAEFGQHLYSVDGEGGIYTQATASASAQIGIFKVEADEPEADAESEVAPKSFGTKVADAGKDYAMGKVQEKIDEVEGSILDALQVQIGSLSGSFGGEASIGGKVNFRTGERTLMVKLDGKVEAAGDILGLAKGEGLGGNRTVALTYEKDGTLKEVKILSEMSKEKFEGIRTTVEDIFGRPIDNGVIAQVSTEDAVKVTYELKPEAVKKVAEAMQRNPAGGIAYAASRPVDKDTVMIKDRSVTAIKRSAAEFKAGFTLSLGAEVGLRGGVTLAHEQETVLTK